MILLDTDVCIEIIRGNEAVIEQRLNCDEPVAICFMTVGELFYGAQRSKYPMKNSALVEEFLLTLDIINTDIDNSIVNTLNVSFPGLKGQVLVNGLSLDGVQIGLSSACSSKTDGGQYVLERAGISSETASCAVRISLSNFNNVEEILKFTEKLEKMVNLLKI